VVHAENIGGDEVRLVLISLVMLVEMVVVTVFLDEQVFFVLDWCSGFGCHLPVDFIFF
jgi:hypothetical protein